VLRAQRPAHQLDPVSHHALRGRQRRRAKRRAGAGGGAAGPRCPRDLELACEPGQS
jgi:hypothetical protein